MAETVLDKSKINGATVTHKGYVRLTAGPQRHKYNHREKADDCLMESYGRHLREDEQVHHLCGNRWCDADWNLVIMPSVLHPYFWKRKRKKNNCRKLEERRRTREKKINVA